MAVVRAVDPDQAARRPDRLVELLTLRSGRTLLLLDGRTGDPAEALYGSRGFVRFGEVPRYALDPDGGGLAPSSFYYLQLRRAPAPGSS